MTGQVSFAARRIAYHEAGHVAMLLARSQPFVSVTTIPYDGAGQRSAKYRGCVRLDEPVGGTCGEFIDIAGGGIIADRIMRRRADFTPETIRNWHKYGWLAPDIRHMIEAVPDKSDLLFLVRQTSLMMQLQWPRVEALARALFTPRVLSYREAAGIVRDAPVLGEAISYRLDERGMLVAEAWA